MPEKAEGDPFILDQGEREDSRKHGDGIMKGQKLQDKKFGQLITQDNQPNKQVEKN